MNGQTDRQRDRPQLPDIVAHFKVVTRHERDYSLCFDFVSSM